MNDRQKVILVVDDEEDIRSLLESFFNGFGYRTLSAADLNQTVFILNREMPDIVFLDIVLPGVNGIEILKLLQKLDDNIIVVMMSGYATEAKAKSALQLGAFDYLSKPFDMSHVKRMLDKINLIIL
ncbi:MAG: response regulator [candidate division Zixibacteria bacterium]|nr:response regulator [Candidatus Tariuqbacter arcticus]